MNPFVQVFNADSFLRRNTLALRPFSIFQIRLCKKPLIGLLDRPSIEKIGFVMSTLAEIIGELTNIDPVDGEL